MKAGVWLTVRKGQIRFAPTPARLGPAWMPGRRDFWRRPNDRSRLVGFLGEVCVVIVECRAAAGANGDIPKPCTIRPHCIGRNLGRSVAQRTVYELHVWCPW